MTTPTADDKLIIPPPPDDWRTWTDYVDALWPSVADEGHSQAELDQAQQWATAEGIASVANCGQDPFGDYQTGQLLWMLARGDRISRGQRARLTGIAQASAALLVIAEAEESDDHDVAAIHEFAKIWTLATASADPV
jgi:hypothetical protein